MIVEQSANHRYTEVEYGKKQDDCYVFCAVLFHCFAMCEDKDMNKKANYETQTKISTPMSVVHKIPFGSNFMHFVTIIYPLGILYLVM